MARGGFGVPIGTSVFSYTYPIRDAAFPWNNRFHLIPLRNKLTPLSGGAVVNPPVYRRTIT